MKIEDRSLAAPAPQAFNKPTASSSFLKKSKLIGSCSTCSPGMETIQQELLLEIKGSPLSEHKQSSAKAPSYTTGAVRLRVGPLPINNGNNLEGEINKQGKQHVMLRNKDKQTNK